MGGSFLDRDSWIVTDLFFWIGIGLIFLGGGEGT
jgi:hypothetical protein